MASFTTSDISVKREKFDYQPVFESIALLNAEPSSVERDDYERANNYRDTTNLYVKLDHFANISWKTKLPNNSGDLFEQSFYEYCELGLSIPQIPFGEFEVYPCDPPKSSDKNGVVLKSIVDFIAINKKYWFPIEVKDSLHFDSGKDFTYVGFRKRYQALALYVHGNRTLSCRLSKQTLLNKERLPGIVVRRDARSELSGDVFKYEHHCSVFVVQ